MRRWANRVLVMLLADYAGAERIQPGIRGEVRRWVVEQGYGTARRPARLGAAISYVHSALPALTEWSARHDHLREITRDEVLAHVGELLGRQRQMTVVALRSLFAWAKRRGVMFANPTACVPTGTVAQPVWQPLTPEEIARTVEAATTARDRLVVALAAVHAARAGAIRSLTLDDLDRRTGGSPSPASPAPSTLSLSGSWSSGSTTGETTGPTPPTRTC